MGKEYTERMERRENRTNGEWNTEKTRVTGDTEYGYKIWDGEKGNGVDNMLNIV